MTDEEKEELKMLLIKNYYSGSSGNLYSIDNGTTKILIEAGAPIKKIKESLNFGLSVVPGALISHRHL
jgi:hypothetical protein